MPSVLETAVLVASRRRCCLCVYLLGRNETREGQIAHLNHKRDDSRFENLVFLCLEHHNQYDSSTRQAKGLTKGEVKEYRRKLYEANERLDPNAKRAFRREALFGDDENSDDQAVSDNAVQTLRAWRFPLWQIADEPQFFAYRARNHCDGIALIERINLDDGRIAIACIEAGGNPGQSITNSVETLCHQVCERFEIPADRLVWLEHYDFDETGEWRMVTFGQHPPDGPFADPKWTIMTPKLWSQLKLKPKKQLRRSDGNYSSKLIKSFSWPPEDPALFSGD